MGTQLEHDGRSIKFIGAVGLDDFGKALKHFEQAYKLLGGSVPMYSDFVDWLMTTDLVEVTPPLDNYTNADKISLTPEQLEVTAKAAGMIPK